MFISEEKNNNFSPGVNIHTDLEFARKCGLTQRYVSGAMLEGWLAEELRLKRMSLKFIAPVNVGDEITYKTKGDEVWCENQRGEKVVVGTYQ